MTYSCSVQVTPGAGRLTVAPGALLFVPDVEDGEVGDELTCALADATSGHEHAEPDSSGRVSGLVADVVMRDVDETPDFILITWPVATQDRLYVMVRGDVAVSSDLPSVPSLSGAASATWSEHRVPGSPETAQFSAGLEPASWSGLIEGTVPAGGFRLTLTEVVAPDPPSRRADPPQQPTTSAPLARSLTGRTSATGLDALAAAVDPDAVEAHDPAHDVAPPTDDEQRTRLDVERPPRSAAPDETTLTETDLAPAAAIDQPAMASPALRRPAMVPSRMCPSGHPNPPHAMTCRSCGLALASDDELTIEQPVLATLALDGLAPVRVDDRLVIGRRPTLEAARQPTGRCLAIPSPLEVSRTHCVVAADGWQITVTDCGSKAGTALLAVGSTIPVRLDPWVPHEADIGDTILLGGPTTARLATPDANAT